MSQTICLDHITDAVLRDHVSDVTQRSCSYCTRTATPRENAFAVPMDSVAAHVYGAATWLYEDESEAWGPADWQERFDTNVVVEDCTTGDFDATIIDRVNADITAAIQTPQQWVGAGIEDEFGFSWEAFTNTVKYTTRFIRIGNSTRPGFADEPPAQVAKFLDGLLAYVQTSMLITMQPGEKLYRGRMAEDTDELWKDVEKSPGEKLGPPPHGVAAAGRLNPEGVGLFYSATTVDVAVKEIALHSPFNDALIGGFVIKKPLVILDFTRRPKLPSVYARDQRHKFLFARFIDEFVKRLTAPVFLAGRERINYVPTQVIAEYLRWVPERRIDGLAWPSHLDPAGKNVGLFVSAGPDVQSDPPVPNSSKATAFLHRAIGGVPTPTLTLSNSDLSKHSVTRSVDVRHVISLRKPFVP